MSQAPPRTTPSPRAALVVVTLAILLLVTFGTVSAMLGGSSNSPRQPRRPTGTTLLPVRATAALESIKQPGVPPNNVSDAIYIPTHSHVISEHTSRAGLGLFHATVRFQVQASELEVIDFFKKVMPQAGWRVENVGPPHNGGGIEVLGQIAGSDGWYWQIGAIVAPTTFQTASGGALNGMTPFTIELYQQNDPD